MADRSTDTKNSILFSEGESSLKNKPSILNSRREISISSKPLLTTIDTQTEILNYSVAPLF